MNLSTFDAFKKIRYENAIPVENETLKKCQQVFLQIAEDVIAVCEKEHIWYQLSGGTALGAVREGGFIPWDDDIDLNVKGKDFERLGKKVEETFSGKYKFIYYGIPDWGLPMGRIMMNGTIFRERDGVGTENCGFFIDIFPIENVPDNKILRKVHGIVCMTFGLLSSCRKFFKKRKFLIEVAKNNPEIKKAIQTKIIIGSIFSFLPLSILANLTDKFYGFCKNENSKYVSIPSGRKHYFGEMYRREGMMNTHAEKFENHQWQVANDFDDYFTKLYGSDYMTPPPEEKREKHTLIELKFPENEDFLSDRN